MEDVRKIIGGFLALIFGVYLLSILAKELPAVSGGLQFGPLIVGVFIFYVIAWVLKEVLGK